MELLKAIATRHSTRQFKDKQITNQELEAVLLAGNASGVAMGQYDCMHMTVVQNRDLLNKINDAGAKAMNNPNAKPIYNAPTIVVLSAPVYDRMPGAEFANVGCVMQNMLLMATDLGVGSVYLLGFIAGFKAAPELLSELEIPEGFKPLAAIGLGYPLEPLVEREITTKIAKNVIL